MANHLFLFTHADVAGLEQLSAEQWSAAYSAAMLNAAAAATATAAANARSQPQFGSITSSPSTTSSSSPPHCPPTSHSQHHHHHQLQLLQTQQGQREESTSLMKQETTSSQQAGNPYNLMTVGALLKIQNSSGTAVPSMGASAGDIGSAGVCKPTGNNHVGTLLGVKNGHGLSSQSNNMMATVKGLSGTPSPPSISATLTQHLQDPTAVKLGPSSHHALPSTPQATSMSALVSKRPAPLQIRPGVNRLVDETAGGVAAPTTPASPYTGQQGWC